MNDPRPLLAGVCGYPIVQSKSPLLFAHWFKVYSLNAHYVPLLVEPQAFPDAVRSLPKFGFRGVNVTIPHKEAALAAADTVSAAAEAIGAANTLIFSADGQISADNTDGFGFLQNLQSTCPTWRADNGPALLLGAGGAARAAIHVLLEAGTSEIRLANRTEDRARDLAAHFGQRVHVVPWSEREEAARGANLIANSTSLGMIGAPPLEFRLDAASDTTLVTDMVYNPLTTPLLSDARARGMPIVDGLGMLLHQARPGCRAWFSIDPDVTPQLRGACLETAR